MNTSLCTRGTPGIRFPSSATKANPPGHVVAGATGVQGAVDPTIEGTCMRRPALTRRTSMLPETAGGEQAGAPPEQAESMLALSERKACSTAPLPVPPAPRLAAVAVGAEVYPLPEFVTVMVRMAPKGMVWGVVTVVLTVPSAAVAPVPPPPVSDTISPCE